MWSRCTHVWMHSRKVPFQEYVQFLLCSNNTNTTLPTKQKQSKSLIHRASVTNLDAVCIVWPTKCNKKWFLSQNPIRQVDALPMTPSWDNFGYDWSEKEIYWVWKWWGFEVLGWVGVKICMQWSSRWDCRKMNGAIMGTARKYNPGKG